MSAKIKKIGKYSVKVVTGKNPSTNSENISERDIEMDSRARAAVRSAIDKAKICKKPVAKYDPISKRAYVEYASGEIKYVN